MPIIDRDDTFTQDASTFVDDQAFIGTAGTAILGTTVKDAQPGTAEAATPTKDWAAGGEPVPVRLRVHTAVAGASGGVQFDLVAADNLALTTNPVTLLTKTIAAATLAVNTSHLLGFLAPGTNKRYLGLKVTPLTSASTAGRFIVWLGQPGAGPQDGVVYL